MPVPDHGRRAEFVAPSADTSGAGAGELIITIADSDADHVASTTAGRAAAAVATHRASPRPGRVQAAARKTHAVTEVVPGPGPSPVVISSTTVARTTGA